MAGLFSWLAAAFSRSQVVNPVEVVEPPALYFQHTRIGGSLTPDDVSNILRTADTGYMWRLCDLGNESRQKDCHLQSILGTREMAVSGMSPLVTPALTRGPVPKRKDAKIAEWCAEWLASFGTHSADADEQQVRDLRHLISHMAGGNFFGYAVAETLFERDGGYVIPVGSVPIAPRRFVFDIATARHMLWDVQGSVAYPGTDLRAEFPGRFVSFYPRVNGDVESREGLVRLLVWASLFRNWALADWLKLAEIAWKPWRTGKYATGRGSIGLKGNADKADRNILLSALQQITTNGIAVLPDTTELKVEWPSKGSGNAQHQKLCEYLAKEMSKAVLGQTMTTEDGSSKSQAEVHNEVRHDIRDADAFAIAACIRRDIIAPAVRLNFGKDASIPGFSLVAPRSINLLEQAQTVKAYSDAGLAVSAKWARETAGIPEPKIGEELVGGGVYAKPADEPKKPPPKEPTDPGPEAEPAEEDIEEEPAKAA